jgi:hypothetical protein
MGLKCDVFLIDRQNYFDYPVIPSQSKDEAQSQDLSSSFQQLTLQLLTWWIDTAIAATLTCTVLREFDKPSEGFFTFLGCISRAGIDHFIGLVFPYIILVQQTFFSPIERAIGFAVELGEFLQRWFTWWIRVGCFAHERIGHRLG